MTKLQKPKLQRRRVLTSALGLVVLTAALLLITLSPRQVDTGVKAHIKQAFLKLHTAGLPEWIGYAQFEFTANIAMFAVFAFFIGRLLSRRGLAVAAVALPLLSVLIELIQLIFLPGRVASVADVVANALGAWLGLALAAVSNRSFSKATDPHRLPTEQYFDDEQLT